MSHVVTVHTTPSVRVDEMRAGTIFRDNYGDEWRRGRRHGAHSGVYLATRLRDGYESCFAGCAKHVVHVDV